MYARHRQCFYPPTHSAKACNGHRIKWKLGTGNPVPASHMMTGNSNTRQKSPSVFRDVHRQGSGIKVEPGLQHSNRRCESLNPVSQPIAPIYLLSHSSHCYIFDI